MKILLLSILTVVVIGLMIPSAVAQTNPNLIVSADRVNTDGDWSSVDGVFSAIQIVEIVIDDPDISNTGIEQTPPDVTINGEKILMVQATDGKWYAYVAYTYAIQFGDSHEAIDFGEFCAASSDSSVIGVDTNNIFADVLAIPRHYSYTYQYITLRLPESRCSYHRLPQLQVRPRRFRT